MTNAVGRSLPISPFRQLVIDLMHFSSHVPSVTADRRMDLGPLVSARQGCSPRPSWCVLFARAYGLVCRDHPVLRRSYLKFPRARLYEHPHSVVSLNVERQLPDENIVLYCLIRGPENRSIAEMDAIVQRHKEDPLETLRSYQRACAVSRIPWPLRYGFWWGSLNMFGRRRAHNFGTFGITSIGAQGAGLSHLIPLLTTTLHFGLLDEEDRLDVRLSWDHRVTDGATIARALVDLEAVLNQEIVWELKRALHQAA